MIKVNDLVIGVVLFFVAHLLTFFQLNGQFLKNDWFRKNEFLVALSGVILSYFYMYGTKYTVSGTDGLLWPARFIGFSIGMLIYAVLVNYHFAEGMNTKTVVSLILCLILLGVQFFWK